MDASRKPVLMAGRVTLVNPYDMFSENFVYVMRLTKQETVGINGVLYPVSGETYDGYLSYQRKLTDDWEREISKDQIAGREAINIFHDEGKTGDYKPAANKEKPIRDAYRALEKEHAKTADIPEGFMPDFEETGPLF